MVMDKSVLQAGEPLGQDKSSSHNGNPYDIARQDIAESMEWFSGLEKLDALPGKGGEGGKTAEKAGKEKKSEPIADMDPVKPAPEKTDEQAAANIGQICPQREIGV